MASININTWTFTKPTIDWQEGSVFIQHGNLFVSPNCRRPVSIPAVRRGNESPFTGDFTMSAEMYKQPVWWNDTYGWMSFVPLSPSYIPTPFAPLCWTPRIEKIMEPLTKSTLYQMHSEDLAVWLKVENRITEAAMRIRVAYAIQGNLPPAPSVFDFMSPSSSLERLSKIIEKARDWFALWMGIISFVIEQIAFHNQFVDSTREDFLPLWYRKLREKPDMWSEAWLNGLMNSSVTKFDDTVPRAGIILDWTCPDITRPPITWFLEHNIPVFYPWSTVEETEARRLYHLSNLQPPTAMIQQAFTFLVSTPGLSPSFPLIALCVKNHGPHRTDTHELTSKFLNLDQAVSTIVNMAMDRFVYDYPKLSNAVKGDLVELRKELVGILENEEMLVEQRAKRAANLPTQGMLTDDDTDDRQRTCLVEDFKDFFWLREQREAEVMQKEDSEARERRKNRERNPGIRKANVYVWSKVQSSGGKSVYMRCHVTSKSKDDEFGCYPPSQRRFSAVFNEWDLCEFLDPNAAHDSDSDEDEDYLYGKRTLSSLVPDLSSPSLLSPESPLSPSPVGAEPEPDTENDSDIPVPEIGDERNADEHAQNDDKLDDWERRDVLQHFSLLYGYVPTLSTESVNDLPPVLTVEWKLTLKNCGFEVDVVQSGNAHEVPEHLRPSIVSFYKSLSQKSQSVRIDDDLDDLNPSNRAALSHLASKFLAGIQRPAENLFIFSEPPSDAAQWLLGVESPEIALYVVRYHLAHPNYTIMTILSHLVARGIKCRTLYRHDISLNGIPATMAYNPSSFRHVDHKFTGEDFMAWFDMMKGILHRPQGRAALLMGGIVRRIASHFLSLDAALMGPSVESSSGTGFMCPSGREGVMYCDDELTEHDIALVCGAYSLYDGMFFSLKPK